MKRYTIDAWVAPGVQVASEATDDRAEAFVIAEGLRQRFEAHRPSVVIFDNEACGCAECHGGIIEEGEDDD